MGNLKKTRKQEENACFLNYFRNKLSTNTTDSVLLAKSSFTHSKFTVENWNPDRNMVKLFNKQKELDYNNDDDIIFQELNEDL